MSACIKVMMQQDDRNAFIVLPTNLPKNTKKNRVRIDEKDKTSPMAIIYREDPVTHIKYPKVACARVSCVELSQWCAKKIAEFEEQNEEIQ